MAVLPTFFRQAHAALRTELPPTVRLAVPVVLAELGWMSMGLVDMAFVGRVSVTAMGAVAVGGSLFFSVAVFGMGVLLSLDYLVAYARGAGDWRDAQRWLVHGVYLSIVLSAVLTAALRASRPWLPALGVRAEVMREALSYFDAVTWSLLPLLLYAALRRYLQAIGDVAPVMVALLSANLVNAVVGWVLIFGHCGVPALGAAGAGWATCAARVYMAGVLAFAIVRNERRRPTGLRRTPLRIELRRLRQLVVLGLPAAVQVTLEVGVFTVVTMLAGRLAAQALAAHQIALNLAAFTFMVPLGISSAAAVRVGQALGAGDVARAERAGWTAVFLGMTFMACAAVTFVSLPRPILRLFTADVAVIASGVGLLLVAAMFQLFDGLQVVATGVLRGSGETRVPMLVNLLGYWLLGLPVGYGLCFVFDWGVVGLWAGLCTGLICVALALVHAWHRRMRWLAVSH